MLHAEPLSLVPAHLLRAVAFVAAVSAAAVLAGSLGAWPLWLVGLVAVLPWLPLVVRLLVWVAHHYGPWLALFAAIVIAQLGHIGEHVAQIAEIHMLGFVPGNARGIFGQLDIEWVHFIWNSLILAGPAALLIRFHSNPWLWLTLLIAGWHWTEHLAIMTVFWDTGTAGDPGLLARGGTIGGGLPLARPELHFLYNLVETTPLVMAFVYAWQRRFPLRVHYALSG